MLFGKPSSPVTSPPPPPPAAKPGLVSRLLFTRSPAPSRRSWFKLGAMAGGGSVLGVMYTVRRYRDSLVSDLSRPVHRDRSEATIASAQPQVVPTVKIVTSAADTATLVDEQKYSEFVRRSVDTLLEAQKEMEAEASRLLAEKVAKCFDKIHPRSEQFADWYFSYTTSFKLLQEGSLSLARHAAKVFEETPINEAVAADMDKFMTQKYERIVLRPEINNSELQAAYLDCVKEVHAKYLATITAIDTNMAELVDTNTSHARPPQQEDVKLSLDWAAQMYKIKSVPVNFEKTPELTLALSSGGAIVGKTLASKGASLATTKALAGKLTAPFVSKVVAAGGGAVAGTVAGPVGTVMGATIGLGIDYSVGLYCLPEDICNLILIVPNSQVNAGIELMKREEFVRDVRQVVAATQQDYRGVLERELHRAVSVWTQDAIQLLPSLATAPRDRGEGREH